ncbi:MAG: DUF58 domain-containing protein [Proteobacteria bacterium]|nr:DUF58 domain-containing protein [Pseudomonadota bacterium]MBS0574571.1 DUF58 domain-containing protein [Pseudomonadota bacterium]
MTPAPDPGAPLALRERAEGLAAPLPALLAAARHLAAAVQTGGHGRRRPGPGAEFWQYRVALAGDEARRIDWRRSARSDLAFVREQEWQAVQTVQIWADGAASMAYRSSADGQTKAGRARLLALATAILLERAGERVGLADGSLAPRSGPAQVARLAEALTRPAAAEDYAAPRAEALAGGARALFLSDFLAGWEGIERTVLAATDRGVTGVLLQVLDPAEEEFPFAGRAIFESMGGSLRHETKEAAGLRARYRERFAARRDQLRGLARLTGWTFGTHRTDHGAQGALLWLHQALGPRR